ncbi:hypothetical protein JCM6882_005962 [Rhodosporidiobolus microsporus]
MSSFPKAQRFRSPPPDELPGPGAYDVPVKAASPAYKKGLAGLARAERLKEDEGGKQPDTFGLYAPGVGEKENMAPATVRRRAASGLAAPSAQAERERHKQQLEDLRARLAAQHEKDLAKLQSKLARVEQVREEAGKEKGELGKEVAALKGEIRSLTSRLTKTTALLEKHQSTLPLLQDKLASLQSSNDASRARKDGEISALKGNVSGLEYALEQATAEREALRKMLGRERDGREEQARAAGEAVDRVVRASEAARVRELVERQQTRVREARLEKHLADRAAQVDALAAYAEGLEARLALAEEQRREAEADRARVERLWRADRELLVSPERGEKEWRQRARADGREAEGLREEVGEMRELAECDREQRGVAEGVERERRKRWGRERKELKRDLEVAEGELDLAVNSEIPRLEALLETASSSLSDTQSSLATLEEDLSTLQQRLVDETDRFEGELEEQRRIADEERKGAEKERAEKRRVVGLLAQTRASEGALRGEVETLTAELSRLTPLLAHTSSQAQTIDVLSRLTAAAESEARQLSEENAELAGHGNQMQKIRHLAQLRQELAESRKKHLATTSSLAFAEQRISALEAELSSYRAVPSSTFSHSHAGFGTDGLATTPATATVQRQRVSRPPMADALSASAAPALSVPRSGPSAPTPTPLAPPPVIISAASPSPASTAGAYLSASAAAPAASRVTFQFEDDPPLLPAHLQDPKLAAAAKKGGKLAKSTPAALAAGGGVRRGVGAKGKKVVRGAEDEAGSSSVRMEGRMSVSELFN